MKLRSLGLDRKLGRLGFDATAKCQRPIGSSLKLGPRANWMVLERVMVLIPVDHWSAGFAIGGARLNRISFGTGCIRRCFKLK